MRRRDFIKGLAGSLVAWPIIVRAQAYPSRPITIVVPTTAGGPPDTIARLLGERMRITLGQPIVVENVTGAGGTIGVGRVVRAEPDGYTLSIGHLNSHVFSGATYALPFDLLEDLQPIALLTTFTAGIHRKKQPAAQHSDRADRMAQGEPQCDVRQRRHGRTRARVGRLFSKVRRRAPAVCPLSRRRFIRAGRDRRPD